MTFTVLRLLTHSELGMFHAYRRDGREGSKQRAINFDWDVVDRVFPSAKDSDKIEIDCDCVDDAYNVVHKRQWLKKQEKNWRFEGYCPTSEYYKFVTPGVLFAMVVDSSTLPARASWVVIPMEHPAREAILNHGESTRLDKSAMIALYGDEGGYCRGVLSHHFPRLFAPAALGVAEPPPDRGLEPDPVGLWDILARAGHRLPSAVADLVDNSISKDATEIAITFPNPNQGGRWLCVRDNGVGMTSDELREAMRVGSRRRYDDGDLGKFGYGLKGASWSQADCLTVVTRAAGSDASTLTWDKEHLSRIRRWEPLSTRPDARYDAAIEVGRRGTAVLLTRMRPPVEMPTLKGIEPYVQEVTSIREHLELVFHRYLEGKVPGRAKVVITLNGEALVPNNPMGHALTKSFDPRTITLPADGASKGADIVVRCHVTPNDDELERFHAGDAPDAARDARDRFTLGGRWSESQGFYFYRLHRLIKWGGWEGMFALDEKTKLVRVAVDFDRGADDPLQVDISKQIIRLPQAVKARLEEILKEPRAEARVRYAKQAPAGGTGSTPKGGGTGKTTKVTPPGKPPGGGSGGGGGGGKPTKTDGPTIRLVQTGSVPWARKTGFTGVVVEVTPRLPALVGLVNAVQGDALATRALSDFLKLLEDADVVRILDERP